MVFRYAGKVEQLAREVEAVQGRLNESYLKILGSERYDKLDKVSKKVLTPEGVYENMNELYRNLNIEGVFSNSPSHNLANYPIFNETGLEKILLTSFFHLPESALINSPYNSGSKFGANYLATYIHEFNHFVFDVLQKPPAVLFAQETFIDDEFVVRDNRDFSKLMNAINQEEGSLEDKKRKADNLMNEFYIDFYQEAGTRILDSLVINSLGYKFSHDWRGKKGKHLIYTPRGFSKSYSIPVTNTDAFLGVSDSEVVEKVINWQDNFYIPHSDSELAKILEVSKTVPLEFVSPEEFLKVRRESMVGEC